MGEPSADVQWWIETLTGGIDQDLVDAHGGPIPFARAIAGTGCCCERITPMNGNDPYTATCLACEAQSLLRALEGREPQEVEFGKVVSG